MFSVILLDTRPPSQLVMATATLTKAVRLLLSEVEGKGFNIEFSGIAFMLIISFFLSLPLKQIQRIKHLPKINQKRALI
jgi:hypothetical protein